MGVHLVCTLVKHRSINMVSVLYRLLCTAARYQFWTCSCKNGYIIFMFTISFLVCCPLCSDDSLVLASDPQLRWCQAYLLRLQLHRVINSWWPASSDLQCAIIGTSKFEGPKFLQRRSTKTYPRAESDKLPPFLLRIKRPTPCLISENKTVQVYNSSVDCNKSSIFS